MIDHCDVCRNNHYGCVCPDKLRAKLDAMTLVADDHAMARLKLSSENAKLRAALEEIAKPVPDGMVPTPGDDDEADKLLTMNRYRRDLARKALAENMPQTTRSSNE